MFRVSLIYINNCPTRCNTKQSMYYSASSLYMFRVSTTPIIRGTQNCNYSLRYWSYILCSYLPPTWPSWPLMEGGSCTVQEAVVTVLCAPDDGCGWHTKHVEWTCRIIYRLLCVASHWMIININCKRDLLICRILCPIINSNLFVIIKHLSYCPNNNNNIIIIIRFLILVCKFNTTNIDQPFTVVVSGYSKYKKLHCVISLSWHFLFYI